MAHTFERYGKGRAHCPVSLVSEVCFPLSSLLSSLSLRRRVKGSFLSLLSSHLSLCDESEIQFALSSLLSSLSLR
jgi:hypothetical protein